MAKANNTWLAKQQLWKELELRHARLFAVMQAKDMLMLAAHEAFGFGPERLKRLGDAFDATFQEYAESVIQESREDKDLWYLQGKMDEKLKQICGEYFVPWAERYS